jgi:putative Holliday junction resolvase
VHFGSVAPIIEKSYVSYNLTVNSRCTKSNRIPYTSRHFLPICFNTDYCLSDVNQKIASPYDVIKEKKFSEVLEIIKNLVKEFDIGSIIVGDPINMDGSFGPKSQSSRSFIANINKDIHIPILLWDERLSTVAAEKSLIEADISRKKRSEVIDKIAANIILQNFLDFLNTNS